jgi:3-oxoadipate enol-lactonase
LLLKETDQAGSSKQILPRREDGAMKINANGIGIHYRMEGPAGAPVVTLSHALAANMSMWDPQMDALASRYRVLRYDIRGHGGTDVPGSPYTLEQLAEDVRSLLHRLGIERTFFIGLSMGSMIGQVLALTCPDRLLGLILCEASSRTSPAVKAIWDERIRIAESLGMEAHVAPTIGRWFTAPFREREHDVVDPVRAMIRTTPVKGYIGCIRAIQGLDLTERIHAIRLPTLLMVGEEDPASPIASSEEIHERIEGSELIILKSAAHLANVEQPGAFNRAVIAFLEKAGPAGEGFGNGSRPGGAAS